MKFMDISSWGRDAPRSGQHARLLLACVALWLLAKAGTPLAETAKPEATPPAPPIALYQPVSAPIAPRVLLYFPFLPVPGVPPQALPPAPPYFWPFPILVIMPPTTVASTQPAQPAGAEAALPTLAAPAVAPTPMADPAAANRPGPAAGAPPHGAIPPSVEGVPAAPAATVGKKAMTAPVPEAKPSAPLSMTPARPEAVAKPKPATRDAKKKARKLCWKDGRLDVCK